MRGLAVSPRFFVGRNVGGWNCDRNTKSRDAVVVLDETLRIVGGSWRGNLRNPINGAGTTREFVRLVMRTDASEAGRVPLRGIGPRATPGGRAARVAARVHGADRGNCRGSHGGS